MQVVVRALSVLRVLAKAPKGLSLGEIGAQLNLPAASAHRMAVVLEREGFITRSTSNRRYFLGPAVRELARADFPRESPLVTAHEAVAEASRNTGETVFLSEFAGNQVICLALSESVFPLRLFVRVGQTMPLHAAAAARVLLAWQPVEAVRARLANAPLTAYTPETPDTLNSVLDHLARVREDGYDVCESELDENVWAVSAPVRSAMNEVVASITMAAPNQRMSDEDTRRKAMRTILSAATQMSVDLGWISKTS